ncbi:hypothetical protein [Alteromonas sp. CNT1-28]|jgi:hypothetical protein|uniref:hypothetical protein n=1 Tax=Alteromonas sp. CNT1-28 TaxID=2917730 RepID=UPI001EF23454|nr:hypothetical protein [Alteromonas sp. CNT1-28]MCG7638091.1 hypothetical protein [Alteromonas sp. CNT1-28]
MLPNDLLVKDELKKLAKEREGFYFLAPTHKCSEFQRVVGEPNFTLIGLDNLRGYYFLNQANGGRESVNIKGYLQNGTHYDLILPLEDNRLNFVLSPQTNKNNKKFIDEGLPCLFSELCELNCKLSRSSLAVRLQSSRTDIEFIISRKTSGFSIHFFLRGEYGGHKRFLEFSVRSDIATQVEVSVNAEKNKVFALENERITPFEDFKRVSVYPVHRVSENHIQIVGKKIIRDFNDDYSDLSKSCFSEIVPNDEFTELGAFTSFRDWICDENGFSSLVYYVPENTMLSLGREISIADTTKYHPDEMSSFSQDLIWGNVLISEN